MAWPFKKKAIEYLNKALEISKQAGTENDWTREAEKTLKLMNSY